MSATDEGNSRRPDPRTVMDFHTNADTDATNEALHHTLGTGSNQAASGSHRHDGTDSFLLLEGYTLSGSRGGNSALATVIGALVQLGANDETTA